MKALAIGLFFILTSCTNLSLPPIQGVRPPVPLFSLIWTKNTDPVYTTGNLPIALNSPLIKAGIVYAGDGNGFMRAWRAEDGKAIWKAKDEGTYHSKAVAFEEDIIYGNSNGRIFSRHRFNGKLSYSIDLNAGIEGVPTLYKGRVFFHLRNHTIVCLDAKTGKVLWNYRRSVSLLTTTQGVSSPIVHKGNLYVGFADGFITALSIEEGVLQWEKKIVSGSKFVDVDTTPVLFQGKLIVGENGRSISVLNPTNGALLMKFNYSVSRTPLVHKGNLLLGTTDGELIFLGSKFEEVRKIKVSRHAISSLTPWKGLLTVATLGGEVHLVDVNQGGALKETFILGHSASAVFGNLSTEADKLAVLSSRHRLYIFR